MKNWLENLIVFSLVFFVIAGPYLLPKFMYGLTRTMPTGTMPLIIYRILLLFSPFYLGSLTCSFLPRGRCLEGGFECFWIIVPMGITLLSYLISLLWYLITFIHTGKASKKGPGRKIKHFVPWLVYVYSFAPAGWFIFCLIAGYINFLLAILVLILFAIIWFFATWKIGKRINKNYG